MFAKKSRQQNSLLLSTVILGGGLLISKVIGAMYRIPLAGILGGEGLGIYQMVFPLYALLLTLSSSAIPASLAKVISENLSQGRGEEAVIVYRTARKYILVVSAICFVLLWFFGDEFAILQGERQGGLSYVAISPSVLLVGFVSCFRGKFQGMNNMLPTALSQICEQVAKLIFSIALPTFFGGTLEEKVALAVFGVTASEFCSLAFLILYSQWCKKKAIKTPFQQVWADGEIRQKNRKRDSLLSRKWKISVLSPLLKIALPMTISYSIYPIAGILESGFIINFLSLAGENGVEQFGLYSGGVVTMMSLPLGICSALGTALIPSISADFARGGQRVARRKISACIKAGMAVALGVSVMFLFFSHQIVSLLFSKIAGSGGGLLERMLKWSFLNVVLSCFSNVTSSILYSLSQGSLPLKSQLWGLLARFAVMVALLPIIGIYASLVGVFVGGILSGFLNFRGINKTLFVPFSFRPLFSGTLCVAVLGFCLAGFSAVFQINTISIFTLGIIYFAFLFLLFFVGYFTKEEISCFVRGKER
ncbi:MAG: polysaccharide biosynthesis protein [Bacillota bacterium]